MRHILALAAALVLAGACLAAEFKSDEAKKAWADYAAALEAAKMTYGQSLAKAKATIDAKAAAATDAISKEVLQTDVRTTWTSPGTTGAPMRRNC